MNRKDKTVKQLQAECRKRKVGFMMNWTKVALTKRLEDEDVRDNDILELKKALDNSKKEIKEITIKKDKSRDVIRDKLIVKQKEIDAISPAQLEQNSWEAIKKTKQRRINSLQGKFDKLHKEQEELRLESNIIAEKKIIIIEEINSLKILLKSL